MERQHDGLRVHDDTAIRRVRPSARTQHCDRGAPDRRWIGCTGDLVGQLLADELLIYVHRQHRASQHRAQRDRVAKAQAAVHVRRAELHGRIRGAHLRVQLGEEQLTRSAAALKFHQLHVQAELVLRPVADARVPRVLVHPPLYKMGSTMVTASASPPQVQN
jgi:hypothetical protein